jgi:hypothetical protein
MGLTCSAWLFDFDDRIARHDEKQTASRQQSANIRTANRPIVDVSVERV